MEQEKITGSVSRIIWQSGDERFSVFRFETESFDTSATLPCPPPPQGQTVELSGSWTVHPRFGRQFKAEGFSIVTPSDSEAIEKFLATGVVEGVGPAMARRLVAKFGEDPQADALIRKYGYRGRLHTLSLLRQPECADLRASQSAAAHLIHGSPDGRFSITYAVKAISQAEIASVGKRTDRLKIA